jgi:hypothetical protein
MASAKNSHAAGPPARPIGGRGSSKFETGNWKLETGHGLEFRVSSFEFPVSTVREGGRKKKNSLQTRQPIENKGSQNKLTEKKRTFWFKYRTFWFNVVTFWRGHAAFFGHFGMSW